MHSVIPRGQWELETINFLSVPYWLLCAIPEREALEYASTLPLYGNGWCLGLSITAIA